MIRGSNIGECGGCGQSDEIRAVVEGKRLCAACRDKWLIEETDSFGIADRLSAKEREIVLTLSGEPSRIGGTDRANTVRACEFALFGKVWGGDCHRYFLTSFGLAVKDAVLRLQSGRCEHGR